MRVQKLIEHFCDGINCRATKASGESVLWLHGYTMDSSLWTKLWSRLDGFHHIGLDLPGHGTSPPLAAPCSLIDLARSLGHECQRRGIRHIAGLSFGAAIAIEVCAEFPDHFTTVSLGAPTLLGADESPEIKRVYLELGRMFGIRGPGPWMADYWTTRATDLFVAASHRPELWSEIQRVTRVHEWSEFRNGFLRQLVSYNQKDDIQRLKSLISSTLIMIGEHETAASKSAANHINFVVQRCRLEVIPNAGHLCFIEDPETTSALMHNHLMGVPSDF